MAKGIIYNKEPSKCMEILDEVEDRSDYIVLHNMNKHLWPEMLKGKKIDPDRVRGIDVTSLIRFGAIFENPVDPFLRSEIIYILAKKFKNPHLDLIEQISLIRKRNCSTPDLMMFNAQVNELLEECSKNIGI